MDGFMIYQPNEAENCFRKTKKLRVRGDEENRYGVRKSQTRCVKTDKIDPRNV